MSFRHVVVFTWADDASPAAIDALAAGLAALPAEIPEIRDYRFGPDAGVNEGNHHYAVVADFDSVDDYLVYRDHPAHRAVITNHVAPILASRAAVQYES